MVRMIGADTEIVVDKNRYRLKAAVYFGAKLTINLEQQIEEEATELIQARTNERGVDVDVECAWQTEVLPQALNWNRRGGLYLMEGVVT